MVGLIGPNGAGKTTLFNCLAGVLDPDARPRPPRRPRPRPPVPEPPGAARHRPHLPTHRAVRRPDRPRAPARRRAGPAPPRRAVARPDRAVASRRPRSEPDADAVLELVGLTGEADVPAQALPLGRGRLVELARALVCEPRLLFLDEPSSGLDHHETGRDGVGARTGPRPSAKLAILLCEHDVPFVRAAGGADLRARLRTADRRRARPPRCWPTRPCAPPTWGWRDEDPGPSVAAPERESTAGIETAPVLELDDVYAAYNQFRALFGVSFIGAHAARRWP